MTDQDGLEVQIIDLSSKLALGTFDTRETIRANSARQRRVGVFAKPEQQFAVRIVATATFDWNGSNGLEVVLGFDRGEVVNEKRLYVAREELKSCRSMRADTALYWLSGGVCVVDHIKVPMFDATGSQAYRSYFRFVHLAEDSVSVNQSKRPPSNAKDPDNQGKIRVEIKRTKLENRLRAGTGLIDTSFDGRWRHSKQELLRTGISLEIQLVPNITDTLEYDGRFKPRTPPSSKQLSFDFIYREERLVANIVRPEHIDVVGLMTTSGLTTPHVRHGDDDTQLVEVWREAPPINVVSKGELSLSSHDTLRTHIGGSDLVYRPRTPLQPRTALTEGIPSIESFFLRFRDEGSVWEERLDQEQSKKHARIDSIAADLALAYRAVDEDDEEIEEMKKHLLQVKRRRLERQGHIALLQQEKSRLEEDKRLDENRQKLLACQRLLSDSEP